MENYFEPCLAPDQLRAMSSIGLAHIGDAVFEILARTWLCAHGSSLIYTSPTHQTDT